MLMYMNVTMPCTTKITEKSRKFKKNQENTLRPPRVKISHGVVTFPTTATKYMNAATLHLK